MAITGTGHPLRRFIYLEPCWQGERNDYLCNDTMSFPFPDPIPYKATPMWHCQSVPLFLHSLFISGSGYRLGIFAELWASLLLLSMPLYVAMQPLSRPPLLTSMPNSKVMILSLPLFHASLPGHREDSQLVFPKAFLFHSIKIVLKIHPKPMLKWFY